jgi:hypothetical protein
MKKKKDTPFVENRDYATWLLSQVVRDLICRLHLNPISDEEVWVYLSDLDKVDEIIKNL